MQQGRYVGKLISRRVAGKNGLKPFRYFDKGNMAVVGKGFAVLQSGRMCVHGIIAWFAWAFIHIAFLAQLSLKISVLLQWAWMFLTGQRGSRIIVNQPAAASPPGGIGGKQESGNSPSRASGPSAIVPETRASPKAPINSTS